MLKEERVTRGNNYGSYLYEGQHVSIKKFVIVY